MLNHAIIYLLIVSYSENILIFKFILSVLKNIYAHQQKSNELPIFAFGFFNLRIITIFKNVYCATFNKICNYRFAFTLLIFKTMVKLNLKVLILLSLFMLPLFFYCAISLVSSLIFMNFVKYQNIHKYHKYQNKTI